MSVFRRFSSVALCALAVGGFMVSDSDAIGKRLEMLPNPPAGCNTCHTVGGGSPRNPFGLAVQELVTPFGSEVFWGPSLAALDSDGDGSTNGEELGDPEGTWIEGDPNPGDPADVTHPGDPESKPPDQPTAVEASSWGKVKNLFGQLVD